MWDFEFHLRKTTTSRKPDLTHEDKAKKKIWICNMACPPQQNIEAKRLEKLTKHKQLAYEYRERHPKYEITVVISKYKIPNTKLPLVTGALGGGIRQIMVDMAKIFEFKDLWNEQSAKCRKQY